MTKTPPSVPSITLGDKSYPLDRLNPAARAQVQNLRIVEAEIQRLRNQIAIAEVAKAAFVQALRTEVPKAA